FFYKMDMVKDGFTTTTLSGTLNADKTILTADNVGTFTLSGNPMTLAVGKLLEIRNSTQAGLYTITSMGSGSSKWILTKVVPVLKPTTLFSKFENILVDTGKFAQKVKALQDSIEDSIYDLAIKITKVSSTDWRFSVYFNGQIIATVQDKTPITYGISQGITLFTRGSSQVMVNDVYAIKTMTSIPSNLSLSSSSEIFDNSKTSNLSYSKYSLSTLISSGFISNISPSKIPENNIYYEEFGTIMRECGYFNVKFDKAYPALKSRITPQPASLAQYLVTGYSSTPYRAEFLVFNLSDFALTLGDGTDYKTILNIVGVTYTEEVARELTVDKFYNLRSDFSTNSNYGSQIYK
ncbi:MAG: hypothetical protein EBS86_17615, partial [Crocinitomicaceae bacterium]|nr:hypothetical protein [Crocinitomicaceae bacterium]